ncbi:NUDIX domain-containing protein [candidate division KSB1 bacterium]|nr:NUDIX domain-containing protein [candidate division KSB1 bacterium]
MKAFADKGREYSIYPRVGVGVVVKRDNHVLLVKRNQQPNKGKWTVPGGLIELGETLRQAIHREIEEECNIRITIEKFIDTFEYIETDHDNQIKYHYIILEYLAHYCTGKLAAKSDISDARWIHSNSFRSLESTNGTAELLNKICFFHNQK